MEVGVGNDSGNVVGAVAVRKVTVWIVAPDASGGPAITRWEVGATEQEIELGYHYDIASDLARDEGYGDPMVAFDESDPAGQSMLALMGMQSIEQQGEVPGAEGAPTWTVPITTNVTLSANVRVRAHDQKAAIEVAREFIANGEGAGLLSLDEGNYKGKADFYCPDPGSVVPASELEEV